MSIDLNGFWQSWDVVSGNTQANNEYEFWNGMVMSNGDVLASQYDFFKYHNTTRYEWFKNLQGTYPEVYDEYTFYRNTNDERITNSYTFYQYCGSYLVPSVTPTPTPTPTITPTNTPTPTVTPTPTPTPSVPPVLSLSYVGEVYSEANLTTYTFNDTNIGGPGLIVLVISSFQTNATPRGFVSVTMNGSNMTDVVTNTPGSSNNNSITMRSMVVTGGTTANISVTFPEPAAGGGTCSITVYRIQNYESAVARETSTFAGAANNTLTTGNITLPTTAPPANTVLITGVMGGGTLGYTFTNIPKDFERSISVGGGTAAFASGSEIVASGAGNTIVIDKSNSANLTFKLLFVGATFR